MLPRQVPLAAIGTRAVISRSGAKRMMPLIHLALHDWYGGLTRHSKVDQTTQQTTTVEAWPTANGLYTATVDSFVFKPRMSGVYRVRYVV